MSQAAADSEREFGDIISLCQFMPGPNIVGIAVCVGTRLRGAIGAVAAASGFLMIPWVIGFAVGVLYLAQAHHPVFQNILGGVAATAAGLMIATGIRLLLPHRRRPAALIFAALAFGLMAFGKLPLLVVLFGLVPLGIVVAAFEANASAARRTDPTYRRDARPKTQAEIARKLGISRSAVCQRRRMLMKRIQRIDPTALFQQPLRVSSLNTFWDFGYIGNDL